MIQHPSRIEDCAVSCAATIEARKIPANEVPIVIACLVNGLSDHTGTPDATIINLVSIASSMLRDSKSRSPKQ